MAYSEQIEYGVNTVSRSNRKSKTN